MKRERVVWSSLLVIVFLVVLGVVQTRSEEPAGETLTDRVGKLETVLSELQLRVSRLEDRLAAGKPSRQAPGASPWKNKASWKSLSKGMARQEVIHVLGEPVKTSTSTSIEIWYYPDATGGWISFDASGHVLGWTEP